MEFKVEFADDEVLWLPYSKDLDDSAPYGDFIESVPYLFPLRFKANLVAKQIASLRKERITVVQPDDVVYVELRCAFGLAWYDTLDIPDKYDIIYVVAVQYIKWRNSSHKFIQPKVLVLDEIMRDWDNYDVVTYGSCKELSDDMYLIDANFVVKYPDIINPANRARLLRLYTQ